MTHLGIADRARLSERLRGRTIGPGDSDYDAARSVWNADIDRLPALIVRCADAGDVQTAIRFAVERGIAVSVRGGGHSVAGHAVCDDGIVVDLSGLRYVEVDAPRRGCEVGGGALWGDVDRATQAHGLAVTGGVVSHTGVGGLTLGGGIGHLMRRCGLTVDNLDWADLITADGRAMRVDAETDPELLWGLRGGGGNFGIVVKFGFRLHDVGPQVLAGMVVHHLEAAPQVMAQYRELIADAPDALGSLVNFRLCPPLPIIPTSLHRRPVVVVAVCWSGGVEVGLDRLRPLRTFGRPLADTIAPTSYQQWQQVSDASVPAGQHYYWRSVNTTSLNEEIVDTLAAHAQRITSMSTTIPIYHLGGVVGSVPPDATAYGPRDDRHNINIFGGWGADGERARHVQWVRGLSADLEPHATGRYVNFLNDEGRRGVRDAYGRRWERLVQLKRRIDPDNVFRHNYNIDPGPHEPAERADAVAGRAQLG